MSAEAVRAERSEDRDGWFWMIEFGTSVSDAEAEAVTWRAAPDEVVLGEHVTVRDPGGDRFGHLSHADYVRDAWTAPFVTCRLELL